MDEKVAQESPGSNSLCSPPKNSVAPTTAMLQKSAPSSPLQYFETMFEGLTSIPPLDAKRFNGSFEHFRSLKHPASDQDSLYVGGKKVNLHSLHVKFMSNRGYETKEVADPSLLPLTQTRRRFSFSKGQGSGRK